MQATMKTRSDWRNHKPGTPEHYMLNLLPRGLDYHPKGGTGHVVQIHDVHRDEGRFTATGEGSGYLKHSVQTESMFNSIPASKWNEAKELLRNCDTLRTPGRILVAAFEFFQFYEVYLLKGTTKDAICRQLGCSPQALGRYRDECMALMEAFVFKHDTPAPASQSA